jgi:hypothetical protein
MRSIVLMPLLMLAACSGGTETAPKEPEAAPASRLDAGQWEMTSEVTSLVNRDAGAPALKLEKGSKTTRSVCVGGEGNEPPVELFAAAEDLKCRYRDTFVSNGRINATLACSRAGLSGDISTIVNGSFTGTTMEGTATTETRLSGDGDVRVDTRLAGRRTGECTAPAPAKG